MGMKVFSSAKTFVAVTPSDSTSVSCKALYIGNTGNVVISAGSTGAGITFVGVPAGLFMPVELQNGRVMAATTATGIVALNW